MEKEDEIFDKEIESIETDNMAKIAVEEFKNVVIKSLKLAEKRNIPEEIACLEMAKQIACIDIDFYLEKNGVHALLAKTYHMLIVSVVENLRNEGRIK